MNRIKQHWREAFVGLASVVVVVYIVSVQYDVPWWVRRLRTMISGADG